MGQLRCQDSLVGGQYGERDSASLYGVWCRASAANHNYGNSGVVVKKSIDGQKIITGMSIPVVCHISFVIQEIVL